MEQRYLKTKQAAAYLGIAESELRRYARQGLLQFSRPGGKLMLFEVSELDYFIARFRGK